jgi:hypothetical protein
MPTMVGWCLVLMWANWMCCNITTADLVPCQ